MNTTTAIRDNALSDAEAIYDHVGRQLRAHRIGRGMTQAQVASLIEISPQQYQKYEDSQTKCSLTYLAILAKHYGVSIVAFLPEDAIEQPAINEADLFARLVAAFSQLDDPTEKLRIVQLIEAMRDARRTS